MAVPVLPCKASSLSRFCSSTDFGITWFHDVSVLCTPSAPHFCGVEGFGRRTIGHHQVSNVFAPRRCPSHMVFLVVDDACLSDLPLLKTATPSRARHGRRIDHLSPQKQRRERLEFLYVSCEVPCTCFQHENTKAKLFFSLESPSIFLFEKRLPSQYVTKNINNRTFGFG